MTHSPDDEPEAQGTGAETKSLVRQHWDGRAAMFDSDSEHGIHSEAQRDAWLSVLREWTGEDRGTVLDVGCGTGVISLLLASLGHDVVGVDFAPAMLERARVKAERTDDNPVFVRGDVETLGVVDGAIEVLTARHLLWTLPDPNAALREWRRVVEPGGRVVLIEGYWDDMEPWDEYEQVHQELPLYQGRPPAELREVLEAAGFRAVEYESLMDPALRGGEPQFDYYVLAGTVPTGFSE